MYLKTSLVLIFFALSLDFAVAAALQDSVKKVNVRVTASEKLPALNFDSLRNTQTPTKEKNSIQQSRKTGIAPAKRPSKIAYRENPVKTTPKQIRSAPATIKTGGATEVKTPEIIDEQVLKPVTVTDNNKSEVTEAESSKTSRAYLWVGFMLIVIGAILGILFGKTALLVSLAGLVFVIIGYTI